MSRFDTVIIVVIVAATTAAAAIAWLDAGNYFYYNAVYAQDPSLPQTQNNTNMTRAIEQMEDSSGTCGPKLIFCVYVLHESPNRIVLEGDYITLMNEYNPEIWNTVELLEGQGFQLDSTLLAGQGTQGNPHKYVIVMTK